MHSLEPYYRWRDLYDSSEDPCTPFHNRVYSEFEYSEKIYDHFIHPQWDNFGSSTLYLKIIFADYNEGFAIIEMIGEWNDAIDNDIMTLKREVIEPMQLNGISKWILIGENVLNFHHSDDCYYEEWFEEVNEDDGWIAMLNFREHVIEEFQVVDVDSYFVMGGQLDEMAWRTLQPLQLFAKIDQLVMKRLMPFS